MQLGKQLNAKDEGSHNCHLEWLFQKQWAYLSRWCGRLKLGIEGDGLEIHEF
jgi:hypothetical protein